MNPSRNSLAVLRCLAVLLLALARAGAAVGDNNPELVLQTGHSKAITSVAFSSDGKWALTGSHDTTAILWDVQTGRQVRVLQGHRFSVSAVAFSPHGKQLLTASVDKTAILWDEETGRQLRSLEGHTSWVKAAAFSPDGQQILTGSQDQTAILWDAATGRPLHRLRGQAGLAGSVTAVAFSPDSKQLLIGSEDSTAILWDVQTEEKVRVFPGHTAALTSVAFSPDGKKILTGSQDHTAILWNAQDGQQLQTLQGHRENVTAVAFSPDGRHLLTGSAERTALLWDTHTGKQVRPYRGHSGGITSVAFSPDGKHILTGSQDQTAILWETESDRPLRTLQGHTRAVSSVAVSPDGKHLLAGSEDRTAVVWHAQGDQPHATFQGHTAKVSSVAFSPDNKQVLTGSFDRTAILWDAPTAQRLRSFAGHTEEVSAVAFSPDGQQVLTASCFDPARGVATGAQDTIAILSDTRSGRQVQTFEGHAYGIKAVAFSPDGQQVLTGSVDRTAMLWDTQTGRRLQTFQGHTGLLAAVNAVAFSPDGRRVLTGSDDHTAILWEAASGRKLQTLQGHSGWLQAVAFSPDGKQALTGALDRKAILWDAQTGEKLRVLEGHTDGVNGVAFLPDGKLVVTGSSDGTVRLWEVASGKELARLLSLDGGRDWLVVTPQGLFDGSAGGRQKVSYRVGDGLTVVPVDRFFQDFYRPGLLASLLSGERPLPEVDLGSQRAPSVRIVSPQQGGTVEANEATLEVEAVDQGGGVQGPWLFHNGARVLAPGAAERVGKTVRRRFRLALVEGDNRLEVRAASSDGAWESEPASLTLRYEKPLDRPELYIVAVGVSRYAQENLRLQFCAADAEAMASLFKDRGRALYHAVHVQSLLNEQATRDNIHHAFLEIKGKARAQDTLLVFLAGHGTMVGQRYYFIPYEFHPSEGVALEEDVRKQGLAHDVLAEDVAAVPALKRVLVLDTCASGGAVGLTKTARNPFALRGAIERLARNQGVYALAAAASSEEAHEVAELGHGVLTYTLLAGLHAVDQGPLADDWVHPSTSDQVVDVLEWFAFAAGKVPQLTRKYFGREQEVVPRTEGSSFPVLPLREP